MPFQPKHLQNNAAHFRSGKAWRWALVATAAVGVGLWFLVSRSGKPMGTSASDVVEVSRQTFDVTTTASGELEARKQIEIRSKLETEATIAEIVAEGSVVKKGDLLVRLNTDKIKQQFDQASLELTNSKAQLTAAEHACEIQVIENEQKLRQAKLKVELAELDKQKWLEGDAKTKRQANQLALSKSSLEVARLAERLAQSYRIVQERGYLFISKDEFERDQLSYIEAQSAWITAHLENEVFENFEFRKQEKKFESDLDEAKAEFEQVKINNAIQLDAKTAEKSAKQKVVSLHEELVKRHETQLANATINAPSDGLVVYASSMERFSWRMGSEGPLQIGRQVMPNDLLIVLPDVSEMLASVRVHESLANRLSKGQRTVVKVDAAGGRTYSGVVDAIGVIAEANWRDPNNREYTIKIALDKADTEGLKPSMRCEAQVFLDRADNAITIPAQAVFAQGNVRYVHARRGDRFAKVPVKIGKQSDTLAEVSSGLEPGTWILTREPKVTEVIAATWSDAELKAAGYSGSSDKPQKAGRSSTDAAKTGKAEGAVQATASVSNGP